MDKLNKFDKGFWEKLKRPIFVLAPMADVTDTAFRRIIAKYSKLASSSAGPDVMWTEFVSADGLVLAPEQGRKKLLKDLEYTEAERPIVAQLFTSSLENMEKAARLVKELRFDGVDINMGCPDKSVEKQGSGAALIKNPSLAKELIRAAKRGADPLPVSVKTRAGYNKLDLEWISTLLEEDISALTVHLRTKKEMSKVPAHWEWAREIIGIRDELGKDTLMIFNGDVKDLGDAREKVSETGCDGIMLGRAIFGNPFLFSVGRHSVSGVTSTPSVGETERLEVLIEHTNLFEELLGEYKSFAVMKKHFKAYVNGFDGAAELRAELMETENAKEVSQIIEHFLAQNRLTS